MSAHKVDIRTVMAKYTSNSPNCRPAIAWININNKTESFYGVVIDNEYFINPKTREAYRKEDCVLINYIDEPEDL